MELQDKLLEEPEYRTLREYRMDFGRWIFKSFDETPLNYLDWLRRECLKLAFYIRKYLNHPKTIKRRGKKTETWKGSQFGSGTWSAFKVEKTEDRSFQGPLHKLWKRYNEWARKSV